MFLITPAMLGSLLARVAIRLARHPAGMDWNTAERLSGIRFYKERWPVLTGRVMLSATKGPHVSLWLLAGSRVLATLVALVTA
jgi:hypothetical protein